MTYLSWFSKKSVNDHGQVQIEKIYIWMILVTFFEACFRADIYVLSHLSGKKNLSYSNCDKWKIYTYLCIQFYISTIAWSYILPLAAIGPKAESLCALDNTGKLWSAIFAHGRVPTVSSVFGYSDSVEHPPWCTLLLLFLCKDIHHQHLSVPGTCFKELSYP